MRKLLLFAAALLACPTLAFAAPGDGVDLSWSDCVTGSPLANRNFVCSGTTNAHHNLVVQFRVNAPILNAEAWTATIDYLNDTGNLGSPATGFWRMESDNPCGSATDPLSAGAAGLAGCEADVFDGGTAPVVNPATAWTSDTRSSDASPGQSPGRARIITAYWRQPGMDLQPGVNYHALHLVFRTGHRAQCTDGCSDPGAFVLNDLFIESFDAGQSRHVSGPDMFGDCVTVNDGAAADCGATPVRNQTWGRLKAMYRD